MDISQSKHHRTYELTDVTIGVTKVPMNIAAMGRLFQPDQPWADEHFAERVSGTPHNPPHSAARWPYAVRGHADHTTCPTCGGGARPGGDIVPMAGRHIHWCADPFHNGATVGRFDHTYPERFWPKHAYGNTHPDADASFPMWGIRFAYGDLSDVVDLLNTNPHTRQAYLPIWFPEDTGATEGQRVPCTLGYHFMIRDGALSMRYYIRSMDVYRHMFNDMYFAGRLMRWMADQVDGVHTGDLIVHIASLHMFTNDVVHVVSRGPVDHRNHPRNAHPFSCNLCAGEGKLEDVDTHGVV
jgi:hypothetical protein